MVKLKYSRILNGLSAPIIKIFCVFNIILTPHTVPFKPFKPSTLKSPQKTLGLEFLN
jgi:hypothetical protein